MADFGSLVPDLPPQAVAPQGQGGEGLAAQLLRQLLTMRGADTAARAGIYDATSAPVGSGVGAGARLATGAPTPEQPIPSWPEIGAGAALAALPGARGIVHAAPKVATGLGLGAILGMSTGEAGEPQFNWSDPNADRVKRLDALDREIEKEATRRTPSAAGTQKARMDGLNAEKQKLIDQRGTEYNDAFTRWQTSESARIESERPFREQYPNTYRALPLAGWATSALGGALGSKGGRPIASTISGALGGVPASLAAAVGPTAYDAATLPTGSKYQQQAYDWLRNPDYWQGRVAPEVLTGMMTGATAGKLGSQVRPGPRQPMREPAMPAPGPSSAPPLAPPPTSAPAASVPASPAPASMPGAVFDRNAGVWRDRITGRPIEPTARPGDEYGGMGMLSGVIR